MKNLISIIMGMTLFFAGNNVFAQTKGNKEQKKSDIKKSESRISLEDSEIVLYDDNGKEIKKKFVYESSIKWMKESSKLDRKILKKLGLKAQWEVKGEKLIKKFKEEKNKIRTFKKLSNPRLRFYDEEGKVKKEISLATKTYKPKKDEKVIGVWTRVIKKKAEASENGKHAILIEDNVLSYAEAPTHIINFYNSHGEILWKKEFPSCKIVDGFAVSNNGRTILREIGAFETHCKDRDTKFGLAVYDKNGNEILRFPDNDNIRKYGIDGNIHVSPNGRYASASFTDTKNYTNIPIFFDLESRRYFVFNNDGSYVYRISNDGIVEVGYNFIKGPEYIDLKTKEFEAIK
ncbi:MAG: hypothetical protein L6420_02200 [Elusimicrobia bacterium]|nr:hypothetical protein [bacterium]MCG2725065.1 hypothetical protein [Elusimicrobiota bacterium]